MHEAKKKPKWRHVQETILDFITRRGLAEGDKLPSDQDFLEILTGENKKAEFRAFHRPEFKGLSKQPLVRALEELARNGIIARRAGAVTTFRSLTPRLYDLEFMYFNGVPSPPAHQDDYGFGSTAREVYGHKVANKLIEQSLRPPLPDGEAAAWERQAHRALGLRRNQPFIAIARVRILDGRPRVIHRSYLNPANFPASFLRDHDFESESLIRIYNESGYVIDRRDTVLRARYPTAEDRSILGIDRVPIMEAEQDLYATHTATAARCVIEHLRVCYLDWEYRISNRSGHSGEAMP